MNFEIQNLQQEVPVEHDFWTRAFEFGAQKLEIECFAFKIVCAFVSPLDTPKMRPFTIGATKIYKDAVLIWVAARPVSPFSFSLGREDASGEGQMVHTFFHELTHAKQLLKRELIVKPRSRIWQGEKWDNKHYSFAPWEVEAEQKSEELYQGFLRWEVMRAMREEANGYAVASKLHLVFPPEAVFRVTSSEQAA